MENNKIMEAIKEINTKGTIQEQARELVDYTTQFWTSSAIEKTFPYNFVYL